MRMDGLRTNSRDRCQGLVNGVYAMAASPDLNTLSPDSVVWPEGHKARGSGCFGAVYEVKVNGFPCIAKRLHDVLNQVDDLGRSKNDGRSVLERFMQECKLLSTLRHPNIVQFIGIFKGSREHEVSLVMEGLHSDLGKFLEPESNPNVPLFLKLSILLDISNALVYLHMHSPPIIHRDVKAANVLLSHDMRAKLADLGVSKLLDFHPLSSTIQTQCPGTHGIMPPEALQPEPVYNTKLDVFSFGTLILHTTNQNFPMPYEVSAASKKGEMQIAKRKFDIDMLGKDHCLYKTVLQCLKDDPSKRPAILPVRDTIEKLSESQTRHFTTFYRMYQEMEGLRRELASVQGQASRAEKLSSQHQIEAREAKTSKKIAEARASRAEERSMVAETQARVFEEDFQTERRDRERAAGEYDESRCLLEKEIEELSSQLQLEKKQKEKLAYEIDRMKERERRERFPSKVLGAFSRKSTEARKTATAPAPHMPPVPPVQPMLHRTPMPPTPPVTVLRQEEEEDDQADVLQSLRFVPAEHSHQGYRCNSRYEWYQTSSDVCINIMIPNVMTDDIIMKFTDTKVKVYIETETTPYNLSLHVPHKILPDKCSMSLLKLKVEVKLKKAEGIQWQTLDERGTSSVAATIQYQKWDTIREEDY